MPHKHTRREKDLSTFDLPPTQIAKPLPVTTISKKKDPPPPPPSSSKQKGAGAQKGKATTDGSENKDKDPTKSNKKRKRNGGGQKDDDVPRAFKRLMAYASGKKTKNAGLDDPEARAARIKAIKAAKANNKNSNPTSSSSSSSTPTVGQPTPVVEEKKQQKKEQKQKEKEIKNDDLTIRPGERLSEFNQRVDAALPISGLAKKVTIGKDGKDALGIKIRRTRKEMKMHKLYDEWRVQDAKVKERREEELEEAEEKAMEEEETLGVANRLALEQQGKSRKKRGKMEEEEDPWEELKRKRGEAKIGLNETVNSVPELKKFSAGKLLKEVRGARVEVDDIPKSAGSLRKREELHGIRAEVVEGYRRMMAEKKSKLQASE
ncbi:hypothetical protein QBC46DRAFT_287660 [Diplogelasinospora grovesii]|uniref:Urease accessory protein n=1 Tax=Diplogelasinospora grovesii TaxID=303347 RepID=A0AAN6N7R4_9PEZI|nr:hypothetical protein QBC46DRAFT_287660 [Diplogelasinospora grovesii]